jgi:DNA-binding MarR family transcriptional regulator
MRLEGGEWLVLANLRDLGGDSGGYVEDARLAAAVRMDRRDVRDWLETLEGKGLVERSVGTEGISAYITARGRQALRLLEPIPTRSDAVAPPVSAAPQPASPVASRPGAPTREAAGGPRASGPIQVFYSYSHRDESLRDELEEHLSLLRRQGIIAGWHDRRIGAGEEWKGEIDRFLESSQVILLLVSPSFLASDYCYEIEARRAIERHEKGEARVIPVILRPVDWKGAPFAKLAVLPKGGEPVTSWKDRDEAFLDVAVGIRTAVEEMMARAR